MDAAGAGFAVGQYRGDWITGMTGGLTIRSRGHLLHPDGIDQWRLDDDANEVRDRLVAVLGPPAREEELTPGMANYLYLVRDRLWVSLDLSEDRFIGYSYWGGAAAAATPEGWVSAPPSRSCVPPTRAASPSHLPGATRLKGDMPRRSARPRHLPHLPVRGRRPES